MQLCTQWLTDGKMEQWIPPLLVLQKCVTFVCSRTADVEGNEGFVQFVTLDREMAVHWQKTFCKMGANSFSNYIQDYPMDPTMNTRGDCQTMNSDYGFAINHNAGRQPSDDVVNGISRPHLLKGTDDPFIKELFTKLSQVLNLKCKWKAHCFQ